MSEEVKCPSCGAMMTNGVCEYCGYEDTRVSKRMDAQQVNVQYNVNVGAINGQHVSPKDWLVTLLLCIFLGGLGVHKFYEGKIGMGIIYLLTCGVFGICWLIDIIKIALSKERDKQGLFIVRQ